MQSRQSLRSKSIARSRSIMAQGSMRSRKSMAFNNDDPELNLSNQRLARVTSKAINRFDRKKVSKFAQLASGTASKVLTAYLGFRDPRKRRREYLIPKDKAAWLEWLVIVAKKRINVEYLTDKELRKVIIRARPNLSPHKSKLEPVEDEDLPACIGWTEKQVGDWIESIGWPQLRETFVRNMITGRRLVLIDCTALNKMGMTDLASMREVAGKIRELLGTPPPNAIRPIMRMPPFERFLHRKVYNGRTYDEMTFEKFCEIEGFNYELLHENKNAQIPCTTEVLITTPEQAEADEDEGEGEDDEEHSLKNAPTVEFLVRNALVRNKTIDQIMQDILENVFLPPRERKYGKEVWGTLKRGIGEGYDDLHLYYSKDKLEFASGVAHHLIDELYKTVAILNDISQLEKHIKEDISPEDMKMFQDAGMALMEEAAPIASLLALGELDLENMFRKQPEFEKYVDEVIQEAEKKTNALVPDAAAFVDEVIQEAWRKIPEMDLTGLTPELRRSILRMTNEILYGIVEDQDDIVSSVVSATTPPDKTTAKGKHDLSRHDMGSPASPKPVGPGAAAGKGKEPPGRVDNKSKMTPQQQQLKRRASQVATRRASQVATRRASQAATRRMSHAATAAHSSTATAAKSGGVSPGASDQVGEGGKEEEKEKDKSEETPPPTEAQTIEGEAEGKQEGKRKTVGIAGPPGTGESGSGGENKDQGDQGKGKGKGKKHEKDAKGKKEEDKPSGGGGEGEGKSQSMVVHTAAVEFNVPPPTPRLATAERRDSPLLRSPMTVATPQTPQTPDQDRDGPIPRSAKRLGSAVGERSKSLGGRGSFETEGTSVAEPPPPQNTAAIVTMPVHPKIPVFRQAQLQPKPQPKVLRMSKDQDRILKPLLEATAAIVEEKEEKKVPEAHPPPEGVSPRQGRKQPPSQLMYNRQQQLLRKQQELTLHTKGEKPRIAYHQRQGIMDPGYRRFGSIEPDDHIAPLNNKGEIPDQPPPSKEHHRPAKPKSNFVMIPKALKQTQVEMAKTAGQAIIVPVQQQVVPPTAPPPSKESHPRLSIHMHPSIADAKLALAEIEKMDRRKKSQALSEKALSEKALSERAESEKAMSESAAQIWEQMKEQFEASKLEKDKPKDQQGKLARDKKQPKGAEESAENARETEAEEAFRKRKEYLSGPLDVIIDPRHVQEMKEHRDILVEDWAKRHSIDPTDPKSNRREKLRLVRMTADKVVTEICTMALTHMLLQAEAGKDTQRILAALQRMELESVRDGQHQEVTLWETKIDPARYGHSNQVFQPRAGPVIQIPRGSDATDTTSTKTAPAPQPLSFQGQQQSGQKRKSEEVAPPPPKQESRVEMTKSEEKPVRSILHVGGASDKELVDGASKLKAQAKSVVVNAVKSVYEEAGKSKPLTRSAPGPKVPSTAIRKVDR